MRTSLIPVMAGGLGFIGKLPDRHFKGSLVDHVLNKSIKAIVLTCTPHTLRKTLSIKNVFALMLFFIFFVFSFYCKDIRRICQYIISDLMSLDRSLKKINLKQESKKIIIDLLSNQRNLFAFCSQSGWELFSFSST